MMAPTDQGTWYSLPGSGVWHRMQVRPCATVLRVLRDGQEPLDLSYCTMGVDSFTGTAFATLFATSPDVDRAHAILDMISPMLLMLERCLLEMP